MSELSNLRAARTLPQLAHLLELKPEALSYALYWYRRENPYDIFTVPKKSGDFRIIAAPNERLKMVQRKLAKLLQLIQADLESKRTIKSRVLAHGFKDDFSIVTNASLHKNRRWVFNVDLKDFFPSVNFGRVYGFFIKDRNFQLDPKIATIIAQIACYRNALPQGSPCSPVISNLVAHILDLELNKLAHGLRCTYTRYADDLTFSTNEMQFPNGIGRPLADAENQWVAGDDLVRIVFRAGFQLNHEKTRLQRQNSRQDVTGLVVNEKVNVRHAYYKQVRAMCHHLFNNGYAYSKESGGAELAGDQSVEGMLAFIHQVRNIKKLTSFKNEQPGFSALYGRFLDYRAFYGIAKPVIICEGKTDNIYLKAAIKNLRAKIFASRKSSRSEPAARRFLSLQRPECVVSGTFRRWR